MIQDCKVVSVLSNANVYGKAEYAINLAVALAKVTEAKVMLVDMARPCEEIAKMLKLDRSAQDNTIVNTKFGIDTMTLERFDKQYLVEIRSRYQYMVINLPVEVDNSLYEAMDYSDVIHFFMASTKDNLEDGHGFLEDLIEKVPKYVLEKLKFVVYRLNVFDKLSLEEISWLIKRDVWAVVPEPGVLDALIDSAGIPIVFKTLNPAYSKAIIYIAKSESDKLLGLALGSGAAFGLAHIGVLKVLEQQHIQVDIISGSSIGSLIASLWGLGFSSDKIEYIAIRLKNKLNIMRLLDFTVPISGILEGKRLKRFLRNILGEKTFEDLQIPVRIMVYDLANRETLAIQRGSLVEAVFKSISVPGIFEPTVEKDRVIVDGGISDPVPVDILLKHGARKTIAVNVLPGPQDIYKRNMFLKKKSREEEDMIREAPFYVRLAVRIKVFFRKKFTPNIFDVIMTSMQSMEYVLAENSCKKADISLHPVLPDAASVDFHLVREFIAKGEEETNSHIEKINALAFN
ncbi:MAG: patatin-like phospholipase family protein [Candidatus Omnitrophica bacterium]|nr:patatin-like phospholipase family protein [Candidatus Omnitrophota bacterium]